MRIFCLLIALCVSLHAAAPGAGEAALAYLEEIREGKINLDSGKATAISPHILEQKRLNIAARLKRLGSELGNGKLNIGREKVEGDLAAVMVWKSDGFDPSQMQVIAIGLVQREGKWLPAPVPASFENCGISYRTDVRKRTKTLEAWMHKHMVSDLSQLREQSIARMRGDIHKHITREDLAKMKPRQVMQQFLDACSRRNAPEIMGLVGGLSDNLPENWPIRSSSIEAATNDLDSPGPWRLLMSPNVVRATVELDDEHGPLHASIACLDPQLIAGSSTREPKVELVHLELILASDGLWQVEVPPHFWEDQDTRANHTHEELDRDLLGRFASEVRKQYPAEPKETVASARKALIEALQQQRFGDLLKLTDIASDPATGRKAILRAAEAWGSLHGLANAENPASAFQLLDLDMKVDGDHAGLLVHAFSARKPDRYDPHALYLQRKKAGWMWLPNPDDALLESFKDWSNATTIEQREGWRLNLLADCPVVTKLGPAAPDENEARKVVEAWIKAIENGNVMAGLEQCARLDLEDSSKVMLRNLGYEVVDALRKDGKGSVKHVLAKGSWVGVGTHPRNPQTRSFSMYPVIQTEKGPRILLEIDLIASSGRGREFLNRTSLTRSKDLGEKTDELLKELFEDHCRQCLPEP